MDEFKRNHVPPFGSWDCNDDLPFTQCFESARQAGLLRYSYSEDRDLYVAGDLYENNVVTPAMIVVPRRRGKARRYTHGKEKKKDANWVVCDYDYNYGGYDYDYECDVKAPPTPINVLVSPPTKPTTQSKPPKPVDEDLYKISPELLRAKPKKKRIWGLFSSCCLVPSCVV